MYKYQAINPFSYSAFLQFERDFTLTFLISISLFIIIIYIYIFLELDYDAVQHIQKIINKESLQFQMLHHFCLYLLISINPVVWQWFFKIQI